MAVGQRLVCSIIKDVCGYQESVIHVHYFINDMFRMPMIATVILDTDNYTGAKQFSVVRDKIQLGMTIIITHNINN